MNNIYSPSPLLLGAAEIKRDTLQRNWDVAFFDQFFLTHYLIEWLLKPVWFSSVCQGENSFKTPIEAFWGSEIVYYLVGEKVGKDHQLQDLYLVSGSTYV